MTRSLGLPRLAVGLAVFPFAVLLAAACGGSDLVDPADGSAVNEPDAHSKDAHAPLDGTVAEGGRSDSALPIDANGSDTSLLDTGVADANADGDTGLHDAAADADANGTDAHVVDASGNDGAIDAAIDAGMDAAIDAKGGLGDAGAGLLGSARKFAVLAGSTITITPSPPLTTIIGDVGTSPGTAIATLPPGQPIGNVFAGGPVALQAQTDLTAAYNALAGMPCLPANVRSGVDLGGKTLPPAVYCFPSTSAGITGDLVLDAQGDPNAVWVFQVGTTLTTGTIATVSVINGGSACNVYWQVGSSATLGTGTKLVGNVVALTSITLVTGSTILVGRALARNGAVNLDGDQISAASCQ